MRSKWIEYWVSELDANGDVIDYTGQTMANEDRNGALARKWYDAEFTHDDAVTKRLERVDSSADEGEDIDRDYTTIAERTR